MISNKSLDNQTLDTVFIVSAQTTTNMWASWRRLGSEVKA